jgi:hypothetical protein
LIVAFRNDIVDLRDVIDRVNSTRVRNHNATVSHSENGSNFDHRLSQWVPSEGDECYTYFRLANAALLFCGLDSSDNKSAPITRDVYDNETVYCGGVPLRPNYCLLPSKGTWVTPIHGNDSTYSLQTNVSPRRFGKNNNFQKNSPSLQ